MWPINRALMNVDNRWRKRGTRRPVGTRGGCGEGRGPGACPGGNTMRLGSVRPTGLIPPRTSTRPPHPPHSTPCPYRTGNVHSLMRWSKSKFIRVPHPFTLSLFFRYNSLSAGPRQSPQRMEIRSDLLLDRPTSPLYSEPKVQIVVEKRTHGQ
jgi:hypothetical protein